MKDLMGLMKQAQQLQENMQRMQEELGALEITGRSGGGLVSVTLNGKGDLKRVKIDPTLLKPDEAEIIEDLLVAAVADAKTKVDAEMQSRMQSVAGGSTSRPPRNPDAPVTRIRGCVVCHWPSAGRCFRTSSHASLI